MISINLDRLKNGIHCGLLEQQKLLTELISSNSVILTVIDAISNIPNAWVGAGIIFQNLWNALHQFPLNSYVKDVDVLYFDSSNLTWEAENSYIKLINDRLKNISIPVDIKNIARVHLWYKDKFNIEKQPYQSVEESISTWPVIGACMAIRKVYDQIEFCAPYGFQDSFAMRVRPNKVLVNKDIYDKKALYWKKQWPLLTIINW